MDNMTIKFAEAVQKRRKELGITQEELAKRVGTTKQVVSKYELGQRSPKVEMANAFASALGTTLDELLEVEKEEQPIHEDPEIHIVSAMMETMSKEQKQQVIDLIKILVKKG